MFVFVRNGEVVPDRIDSLGFTPFEDLPVPYADAPHSPQSLQRSMAQSVQAPRLNQPRQNQLMAYRMFLDDDRFNSEDWEKLLELWQRESSWRHTARNPSSTARGLPQAMGSLNPETMTDEWLNDPEEQIRWGLDYIKRRYGTVARALAHHDRKGWY